MDKRVAVYVRVSSVGQNEASQIHEITRWLAGQGISDPRWFTDKASGNNLRRPGFEALQRAVFDGSVDTIIVYKLDRISRSLADGINTLVGWLNAKVRVVAVSQMLDFSGPAGQLIAAVLFAVAQMEQETRRERQAAGISAARASGRAWGGSAKGRHISVTPEQIATARRLRAEEPTLPVAAIARSTGLSRRTISRLLPQ